MSIDQGQVCCEAHGCPAPVAHVEHFYQRVRGWCAAHTPWSGHYEDHIFARTRPGQRSPCEELLDELRAAGRLPPAAVAPAPRPADVPCEPALPRGARWLVAADGWVYERTPDGTAWRAQELLGTVGPGELRAFVLRRDAPRHPSGAGPFPLLAALRQRAARRSPEHPDTWDFAQRWLARERELANLIERGDADGIDALLARAAADLAPGGAAR